MPLTTWAVIIYIVIELVADLKGVYESKLSILETMWGFLMP